MFRWPAGRNWRLLDWSGDKTRALFVGATPNIVGQLVLATGKFTSFRLPSGAQPLSFSRPDGTAILVAEQASGTDKILRYDLTGRLERALVSGPSSSTNTALYSADGTTLVVDGALTSPRDGKGLTWVTLAPGSYPAGSTCRPRAPAK